MPTPAADGGMAPVGDPAALTDHIERHYHARHREQLERLLELSQTVERVHAGHAGVPAGLATVLARLRGEMEVHMKKEELLLFPWFRRGGKPGLGATIARMRADHDGQDHDMAEIRRLTGGIALPEGACRTWTMLYRGLAEFADDLAEHVRLENDILFPQFESGESSHG